MSPCGDGVLPDCPLPAGHVVVKKDVLVRKTECEGVREPPARALRICRAAHRLHEVHVLWSRSAINDDPTRCYRCHCFAGVVLKVDGEW